MTDYSPTWLKTASLWPARIRLARPCLRPTSQEKRNPPRGSTKRSKKISTKGHEGPRRALSLSTKITKVREGHEMMFPAFGLDVEHESIPDSHGWTGYTGEPFAKFGSALGPWVSPWERGRPARILVKALPRRQSAGEPTNPVKPIATTLPSLVRAGRPRSQGSEPFPAINPTYWRILQKAQDYLLMVWVACFGSRVFTPVSSTTTFFSTRIPKTGCQAHGSLRTRSRSSSGSASSAGASLPVYPVYRCSLMQQTGLAGHGPYSR